MAKGGINPVMPWHSFNNLTGYFRRHNNKESCVRVSVRLKQSLWASALMVSTVVIQSPSTALSQTQFPAQDSGAVQAGWVETFDDASLTALVIEAQANNRDLGARFHKW